MMHSGSRSELATATTTVIDVKTHDTGERSAERLPADHGWRCRFRGR
jgi:hypothetical protein